MKPSEIISSLPEWKNADAHKILSSPAWEMPCRMGETQCTMRLGALRPADTLDISILLENEPHVLSLIDTPEFPELHAIWPSRSEVPAPILLALVEQECGALLQAIENAVRRQLKIEGIADDAQKASAGSDDLLCIQVFDGEKPLLQFALTLSSALVSALGQLRFINPGHESIREQSLRAEVELAAFVLPAADLASLSPGDFVLLPEVDTMPPNFIVDGRFIVDETGVSPFSDDGRMRVCDADPRNVTLGWLFDHAQAPAALEAVNPAQLRLVASGKTIATGRLEKLAEHPALVVEAT